MERYNRKEVDKRRTFGIISHPDAGKTTIFNALTELGDPVTAYANAKAEPNVAIVRVLRKNGVSP